MTNVGQSRSLKNATDATRAVSENPCQSRSVGLLVHITIAPYTMHLAPRVIFDIAFLRANNQFQILNFASHVNDCRVMLLLFRKPVLTTTAKIAVLFVTNVRVVPKSATNARMLPNKEERK